MSILNLYKLQMINYIYIKILTIIMYKAELAVHAVIGFSGNIKDGLNLHPNNEDLVYAIGSSLVYKNALTGKQSFLKEHAHKISVVKVSPNGKYVVTGETLEIGQQATIIVWDFVEKKCKHKLKLHKSNVVCIDFSRNQFYLATQGGREDKNMLIIWDLQNGKTLYGSPNKRQVKQIKYFNQLDTHILSVTQTEVQIQIVDKVHKKIVTQTIDFGNVKRNFTCCDIDKNDMFGYVGTQHGDFYEIDLQKATVKRSGPIKKLFALGITNLKLVPESNDIIIGTGDGTLSRVSLKNMQIKTRSQVMGPVTSIVFTYDFSYFFCATGQCNIFFVNSTNLTTELKSTSHSSKINDIAFPQNYSDVFATCSMSEIRLWNVHNQSELLRIQIPGLECSAVGFTPDGKSVVSGWHDGRIRSFLPQSGKLVYLINDAHLKGVTALAFFHNDSTRIISGGAWGQVRVWKIQKNAQYLLASLKQHCGRVNSIQINKSNQQAISCSSDGSCAIWDLKTYDKINSYQQPDSPLRQVAIHPKQFQFITVSTDGHIVYRQKFDIELLRKFSGCQKPQEKKKTIQKQILMSLQREQKKNDKKQKEKQDLSGVNSIALMNEGYNFVTGGGDKMLKLWEYQYGKEKACGVGHSSVIVKVAVSPDEKSVVSVSDEGEILLWDFPVELLKDFGDAVLSNLKGLSREISEFNRRA